MKQKVTAKIDLTLAAAKTIAESTAKCHAEVRILYRDKVANAKSLMGVVALSFKKGAELIVVAEGTDAARAIENVKRVL